MTSQTESPQAQESGGGGEQGMQRGFQNYSAKQHEKCTGPFSGEQVCPSVTNTHLLPNLASRLAFPGGRFTVRIKSSLQLCPQQPCYSAGVLQHQHRALLPFSK